MEHREGSVAEPQRRVDHDPRPAARPRPFPGDDAQRGRQDAAAVRARRAGARPPLPAGLGTRPRVRHRLPRPPPGAAGAGHRAAIARPGRPALPGTPRPHSPAVALRRDRRRRGRSLRPVGDHAPRHQRRHRSAPHGRVVPADRPERSTAARGRSRCHRGERRRQPFGQGAGRRPGARVRQHGHEDVRPSRPAAARRRPPGRRRGDDLAGGSETGGRQARRTGLDRHVDRRCPARVRTTTCPADRRCGSSDRGTATSSGCRCRSTT